MTAPARRWLATAWPYAGWLALSAAGLTAAWATDPHVFGFAAFAAAGGSGLLILLALFHGLRPVLWSLVAGVPTVVAFAVLSTYRWA